MRGNKLWQSIKNLRSSHTFYGSQNWILVLWRPTGKCEESQYSLTEALCLFWVPPWGLHLSPVTNIHIIDRVLYYRLTFLILIIENWLWKWYRGIEKKKLFKLIFFFFQVFFTHFVHLFYNMHEMYESIYVEIMIMPRVNRFCFAKSKEAENNFLMLWASASLLNT